jgi:ribosome-associated protein
MSETPEEDFPERPSRSARKRTAESAQQLGEQLVMLDDRELERLQLPERLLEAIREARRLHSRAAGARQRQFIGKLMRDIDCEPIRAALADRSEQVTRDALRFRRIEDWRARLIEEGEGALAELARWYPGAREPVLARRVAEARAEQARLGKPGPAARELFRALRTLLQPAED